MYYMFRGYSADLTPLFFGVMRAFETLKTLTTKVKPAIRQNHKTSGETL